MDCYIESCIGDIFKVLPTPISGGGDATRTIIWEIELDSLAAFETHPEKIGADPEMQELFPKLNAVIDSIDVEFYTPIPTS